MNSFLQDIDNALPKEMTPDMLHNCGAENIFLRLHNEVAALKKDMAAGASSAEPTKPRDSRSLVAEELGTLAWQVRKVVSKSDRSSSGSSAQLSGLASSVGHCSEALRGQNEVSHRCKFVLERLREEIAAHKISCSSQLAFVQQDTMQSHSLRSPCFEVQLHNEGKAVRITVVVPSLAGAEGSTHITKAFSVVERELGDAYLRGRESFFAAFFSLFRYFNDLLMNFGNSFGSVLRDIVAVCGGNTSSSSSSSAVNTIPPGTPSSSNIHGAITVNGVRARFGARPGKKALLGGYVVLSSSSQYSPAAAAAAQGGNPQFDLLFEGSPVAFTKSSFLLAVGRGAAITDGIDRFTQWQNANGSAEMCSYERLASGVPGLAKIKNAVRVDESTTFSFRCFEQHMAMTVARIPLRSLGDLPAALGLVARQVAFNKLFASCFRDYKAGSAAGEAGAQEPPQKKAKAEAPAVLKLELASIKLSEEPHFTLTVKSESFSVLVNVARDGVVTAEYNGANCDLLAKMLNLTYNIPFSLHRYMKVSQEQ